MKAERQNVMLLKHVRALPEEVFKNSYGGGAIQELSLHASSQVIEF
jgi:hypothetical protein